MEISAAVLEKETRNVYMNLAWTAPLDNTVAGKCYLREGRRRGRGKVLRSLDGRSGCISR